MHRIVEVLNSTTHNCFPVVHSQVRPVIRISTGIPVVSTFYVPPEQIEMPVFSAHLV